MTVSRPRVLVVDDDPVIRETLQAALETLNCEVITASDGIEGLKRVERDAPQLLVLDLLMPRRNGLSVLRQIKGFRNRTRRVLLISACARDRYEDLVCECGADAWIQKPFELPVFLQTVQKLLADAMEPVSQ